MKTKGRLTNITIPFRSRRPVISFEVDAKAEDIEKYAEKELDITFVRHRNRRSLDANALLWACLGDIAKALRNDPWDVYLYMLERYGKHTYILVKPEAVEKLKAIWRETKVVGEQNGMVQVLCYFGSSTYNTEEFSYLLDGVIYEMKCMHLETPTSEDMRRSLEELENGRKRK